MPDPIDAVNHDALKLMTRSSQSSRLSQVPMRGFLALIPMANHIVDFGVHVFVSKIDFVVLLW